tara:strand:+ start:5898 stop:7304 length:1407 start_codon:yes stop_codon:yes gene_type:complete
MPLILGTNSIKDTGYDVANSLRFNDDDSAYLNRTPSGAGNRKTFTISLWIKRANLVNSRLISCYSANSDTGNFELDFNDNKFRYVAWDTNFRVTNRLFRDTSAWYHIVTAVDTTDSTADDRIKIYVNGVQETSFSSSSNPSQNFDTGFNQASTTRIGIASNSTNGPFDGYMAEVVFIDGQALAPTSFGEFDSDSPNIWKPKNVSGLTFGTNGFHLDFENASSLGADVSGNSNNFTVNNLTATDQLIDTCTNNFATLNSLSSFGGAVLSEGNLKLTSTATAFDHTSATIHIDAGKWYMEFNAVATSGGSAVACFLAGTGEFQNDQTSWISSGDGGFGIGMNGFKITDGVEEGSNSFSAVSSGSIVQIAYDSDSGKAWFGINNTWLASGNPSTGANPYFTSTKLQNNDVVLKLITYTSSNTSIANFGQDSSFAGTKTKQSNQDSNGQGNFYYSPPTNFLSLNTKNLAEFG